ALRSRFVARLALMIRMIPLATRSVKTTRIVRPSCDSPTKVSRSGCSPSSKGTASSSRKTVIASSNVTPCLRTFTLAFASSHSNSPTRSVPISTGRYHGERAAIASPGAGKRRPPPWRTIWRARTDGDRSSLHLGYRRRFGRRNSTWSAFQRDGNWLGVRWALRGLVRGLHARTGQRVPTRRSQARPQDQTVSCFLLYEMGVGEVRRSPAEGCSTRVTPASTFKIPHAARCTRRRSAVGPRRSLLVQRRPVPVGDVEARPHPCDSPAVLRGLVLPARGHAVGGAARGHLPREARLRKPGQF